MLFVSTGISIIMLLVAIWWPRIARFLFFVLFAWAAWTNWQTSQQTPIVYVEYADLVWSNLYKNIINGWFAKHVELVVGLIAVCQGLIAISMLLKGVIFRIGAIGAIVFLAAIIPFGVGSGFPATLIMCIALIIILRKHAADYLWQLNKTAIA